MLPKRDLPTYTFEVPSSGKTIRYRPFTVKEQKLMLMANVDGTKMDDSEVYETLRQVIQNCILTEGFNVEDLASFDFELLFLHLRAKSISETVALNYVCTNEVDGAPCNQPLELNIDISKITVQRPDKDDRKVFFTDTLGVIMNYPNVETIKKIPQFLTSRSDTLNKGAFALITECIGFVFDGEKIHDAREIPKEEMEDFVEHLSTQDYEKILTFFAKIPSVHARVEKACSKCGFSHVVEVEGLTSFFD